MLQMKNKAIFLDRDGTLNTDSGYVYQIKDIEIIEGIIDALKIFQNEGYLLIVVTNQSGVSRGYYKEEDVVNFNNAIKTILTKKGVNIDQFYVCPHLPEDNCVCRKPLPYLLYRAMGDYNIDPNLSFMFGDKITDVVCGENASIRSFLITKEHSLYYWSKKLRDNHFYL